MLIKWLLKLSSTLCLLCTLLSASAMIVPELNVVQVSLPSKDTSLLQPALQHAFKMVLIKYSGNPNIMSLPDVQAALPQLDRWVKQYAYQANPENMNLPWVLQVRFDGKLLEQLLMKANQVLWSADRPAVLSLVYLQQGDEVSVLSGEHQSDLESLMSQRARDRGVPLLWPLFDMVDQNHLSINTLPSIDSNHLADALKQYLLQRYATSVLLFGFVKQDNGVYEGHWSLWLQGQWWTWQSMGDLSDALNQGVAGAANRMAQQMAMMPLGNQSLRIWVGGVDNLSHYADVVKYLKSLGPVTSVDVADLQADGVLLNVNVKVAQSSLAQLINQEHQLSAVLSPMNQQIPYADLYYQWPPVTQAQAEESSDEQQSA